MRRQVEREQSPVPQAEEYLGAGRGKGGFSPRVLVRKRGPADTLISKFWPPELGENTFLLP